MKREFLCNSESSLSETPILGLLSSGSCPGSHWLSKERGKPSLQAYMGFGSPLTISAFGEERAWRRQTRREEPIRKRCPVSASPLNVLVQHFHPFPSRGECALPLKFCSAPRNVTVFADLTENRYNFDSFTPDSYCCFGCFHFFI